MNKYVKNYKSFFIIFSFYFLLSCNQTLEQKQKTHKTCTLTSEMRSVPILLSDSCLYFNYLQHRISPQLIMFTPNYQLWSDGANKSRWIYLPENSQIDTQNPDRWIFPVGTQIFKEFRKTPKQSNTEIKVETRHFQKITPGEGIDSWLINTYIWNKEQTDAKLAFATKNVLNTDHNIPSEQDCVDCHKGNTDIVLGFDAIQLSDEQAKHAFGHGPKRQKNEWTLKSLLAANKLTHSINSPLLPGTVLEQKALGYLHANCGNCHNPLGHAAEQDAKHLKFRHKLSFDSLDKTDVYKTAVNKPTLNFTATPYIILGGEDDELALYQSALFLRMNSLDENYRMPMLATEKIDYQALDLMHKWILTLPTSTDASFNKKKKKQIKSTIFKAISDKDKQLLGPGIQLELQIFNPNNVPDVFAIYWPEDKSLTSSPVMDHKDGYFTKKLLLGDKGSKMSLRNSDDVGHTIYVKDKKNKIKWQLSYMPPGSKFEQELFWEEDIFVEMKCRLHLYMSAWIGSIKSQYYKIIELSQNENYKRTEMSGYPEHFNKLKIWLPKFDLIDIDIKLNEEKTIDLIKSGKILGAVDLCLNFVRK
ncbi:hypothetical protein [Pseudoalteromonas denitrificans]|uniref:Cytochrome c domain-containing protein n=1 Tax=Pseudoalteromonas denitrificans DSM 6059 TaxID=1123010 RepID=A0A1I1TWA8_9GAMM|nr:hypothetical protein [Pseudoalteromonas denitrificans]SFD62956.1 hypothetical protein SAMN02745724_05029 [Pseudoalteromonas denitrificans DSM 6059]